MSLFQIERTIGQFHCLSLTTDRMDPDLKYARFWKSL